MKTPTRFLLGLFSSLLLSAGFVRAAERLDPLSHSLATSDAAAAVSDRPAPACTDPCAYAADLPLTLTD